MSTHREHQSAATEADENMAAWEAGVQRMKETLRARRPDLFDEDGELRVEEAMRLLRQMADERGLTMSDLADQAAQGLRRQADAP